MLLKIISDRLDSNLYYIYCHNHYVSLEKIVYMIRKKTKVVYAGSLAIGGDNAVSIQSMTNVPLEDVKATVDQIHRLNDAGADLVRVAVRNEEAIEYLSQVRKAVKTPLCADIHFNHRIAVKAIQAGIDKVRINPGNIGGIENVKEVVKAAKDYKVPIRVGANAGSIDKKKFDVASAKSLVESAMENIVILEDNDFFDIVVSIKSSDINQTIEANKMFSEIRDYPLHIGLTEAGYGVSCIVQSSVVIGHLLMYGIGDTVRVSLSGDPVEEPVIAAKILESAGVRKPLLRIIACPTCGRTDPDLDIPDLAFKAEHAILDKYGDKLAKRTNTFTVAVMGCEVNGPGEASHADIGIAGGRGHKMLLFAAGKKLGIVENDYAVKALLEEAGKIIANTD